MKLAMMRRIAHHTSGEAKPLTPVQDHALSVFATSIAPLFKRNSDTTTHATLRASCSQGLPKPEGRFCIRFSSARSNRRKQFSNCGRFSAPRHAEDCPPYQRRGLSELIGVRKPLQNRIVTRRAEIFDETAKNRVEQRICVHDVEIERHKLTIQMQLRLVVERVAVVVLQTLFQRPGNDVAQRVKIKMQVERDTVVQSNAFVINFVVADKAKAKGDDLA